MLSLLVPHSYTPSRMRLPPLSCCSTEASKARGRALSVQLTYT